MTIKDCCMRQQPCSACPDASYTNTHLGLCAYPHLDTCTTAILHIMRLYSEPAVLRQTNALHHREGLQAYVCASTYEHVCRSTFSFTGCHGSPPHLTPDVQQVASQQHAPQAIRALAWGGVTLADVQILIFQPAEPQSWRASPYLRP